MLVALTNNDERIYADEAEKEDEFGNKLEYTCPDCGASLILRKGTKNIHHFAHDKDSQESCRYMRISGGESITHDKMKRAVKRIVEKDNSVILSELEWRIGKVIPDYYFKKRDYYGNIVTVAVECVHKHRDIERFREKVQYYYKKRIFSMWVFTLESFLDDDHEFKDEVRIDEILKENHTFNFGSVLVVDIDNERMYEIHLDPVTRLKQVPEYDWAAYNRDKEMNGHAILEHYRNVNAGDVYEVFLKQTKKPVPFLFEKFDVNSFVTKVSDKYLSYPRKVATINKQWL